MSLVAEGAALGRGKVGKSIRAKSPFVDSFHREFFGAPNSIYLAGSFLNLLGHVRLFRNRSYIPFQLLTTTILGSLWPIPAYTSHGAGGA